ncbi:S8 family serine peptidase [bacterium]|nr:S8 family serine peptidase [bacterium]
MKKLFCLALLLGALTLAADPGTIRLRNGVVNSAASSLMAKGVKRCEPDSLGRCQYLIQPEKNFTNKERADLKESGVAFIGFVPPNAYIVLATPEKIGALEEKYPLLYVGEYLPEYKNGIPSATIYSVSSANTELKLLVRLTSIDQASDVIAFLKEQGANDPVILHDAPPVVKVSAGVETVEKLILRSDVMDVEEETECFVMNDAARSASMMNVAAMNTSGYTGKGVKICVADTGLDSGSLSNIHPDFKNKNVAGVVSSTNTGRTDWSDLHGHGTHVAGSAVGTGAYSGGRYAGTAPEADLYFICIGGSNNSVYPPELTDIEAAYESGARVMNNSWGAYSTAISGVYTQDSEFYDAVCHDHPDFTILFAAGNNNKKIDTTGNCTLSTQAACKNVMTVGAAENDRPEFTATYGQLFSNVAAPFNTDQAGSPQNGTQQGMAFFSSRGPAKDGRAKPDIVAPGTFVWSTESLYDSNNGGTRSSYYTTMFGTSMATPLTSGAAADAVQFLKGKGFSAPSSSLVKALLINGARNMGTGQYEDYTEIPDESPNCVNGFGHVNLGESFSPACGNLFLYEGTISDTDDEKTYVFAKSADGPVSATLVWNDYPGTPGAGLALVNDLDIAVTCGDYTFYCDGSDDHCDSLNNVERYRESEFPAGNNIEITVKGYNVMEGPQTFSFVVSGVDAEVVPEPAFALTALLITLLLGRKPNKNL